MRVSNLGANKTEINLNNGDTVYVSYKTPVAANVDGAFYRTSKSWSRTTSRHINQWLRGAKAAEKEQSYFDNLLG